MFYENYTDEGPRIPITYAAVLFGHAIARRSKPGAGGIPILEDRVRDKVPELAADTGRVTAL